MRSRTAIATLAGTVLVLAGGCADDAGSSGPAVRSTQQEPGKHDMPPPVVVIADGPAAPVTLTIGDASAPTDPVATDAAGVLLPPQDVSRLGWWADSSFPGSEAGSIVVTGHIDDVAQGDGFATRFADLAEGDEVVLSLNDGSARQYRVDRLLSVGKDGDLPLDELNRLDGPETLVLVTCGGEFVGPPLGYANNDFVFATPVA
ncbi:class F sortase [Rhodococcus artemisiae]|uniref:Class F sortase n=1 Tax=Rhodococcus artemisiae TaxID=714159 RepID=A0ABU7LGX9_9NOCA|nr:class F sortase [Rhodococcus artemisiae]MEE2060811.1 class F sortase [Rhodococcus artemisiae]